MLKWGKVTSLFFVPYLVGATKDTYHNYNELRIYPFFCYSSLCRNPTITPYFLLGVRKKEFDLIRKIFCFMMCRKRDVNTRYTRWTVIDALLVFAFEKGKANPDS